jgi:hypothetical protein
MEAAASANGELQLALHDALGHHLTGGLNPLLDLIDAGEELLQSRQNLLLKPSDFFLPIGMIGPRALQRLSSLSLQDQPDRKMHAPQEQNGILLGSACGGETRPVVEMMRRRPWS